MNKKIPGSPKNRNKRHISAFYCGFSVLGLHTPRWWILCTLAAFPALAAPPTWERTPLGHYASAPGEPLPEFLARLGRVLADHT